MSLLQKAQTSGVSIFLYIIGLGFAGIVGYEIILQQAVNAIALSIVYGVISQAINAAGTKAGVDHTNSTVEHVAIAQYPMTPGGISAVNEQAGNIAAEKAAVDAKAAAANPPPVEGVKP